MLPPRLRKHPVNHRFFVDRAPSFASTPRHLLGEVTSEETASAIRSSSRDERTNADQTTSGVNNRSRTGKKIVEREPCQIGLI